MRKIRLSGGVDEESFGAFCEALDAFEAESSQPVEFELCSGGGDAYIALAFAARMRTSPCQITVTVYGACQSAAVLILAAGNKRAMTKESWVMVHEDHGEISDKVTLMEVETHHLRAMEDQWAKLLAELTKASAKKWAKLHKETTYLTPEQCVKLGLADEIV